MFDYFFVSCFWSGFIKRDFLKGFRFPLPAILPLIYRWFRPRLSLLWWFRSLKRRWTLLTSTSLNDLFYIFVSSSLIERRFWFILSFWFWERRFWFFAFLSFDLKWWFGFFSFWLFFSSFGFGSYGGFGSSLFFVFFDSLLFLWWSLYLCKFLFHIPFFFRFLLCKYLFNSIWQHHLWLHIFCIFHYFPHWNLFIFLFKPLLLFSFI